MSIFEPEGASVMLAEERESKQTATDPNLRKARGHCVKCGSPLSTSGAIVCEGCISLQGLIDGYTTTTDQYDELVLAIWNLHYAKMHVQRIRRQYVHSAVPTEVIDDLYKLRTQLIALSNSLEPLKQESQLYIFLLAIVCETRLLLDNLTTASRLS